MTATEAEAACEAALTVVNERAEKQAIKKAMNRPEIKAEYRGAEAYCYIPAEADWVIADTVYHAMRLGAQALGIAIPEYGFVRSASLEDAAKAQADGKAVVTSRISMKAQTDFSTGRVVINLDRIDDWKDALRSALHELKHVYNRRWNPHGALDPREEPDAENWAQATAPLIEEKVKQLVMSEYAIRQMIARGDM